MTRYLVLFEAKQDLIREAIERSNLRIRPPDMSGAQNTGSIERRKQTNLSFQRRRRFKRPKRKEAPRRKFDRGQGLACGDPIESVPVLTSSSGRS